MNAPRDNEWVTTEFSSGDWCVIHLWNGEAYEPLFQGPWSGDEGTQTLYHKLERAFAAALKEVKA